MDKPDSILIVDDDPEIRRLLVDYLARNSFDAYAARDGREMWQALERHAIDLVVLDLMLPDTDGLTLCLEALNRDDMAGYAYHLPSQVIAILQRFNSAQLRLQFDYYHCAKEGLNLLDEVRNAAPWIGYVQLAHDDGRFEPDLARNGLLQAVAALPTLGYDGWLGCEYRPRSTPAQGLAWCEPLRTQGLLTD